MQIKKGVIQPSINETAITTDLDINTAKSYSNENEESKVFNIVDYAKQFNGVKYKFGGTTTDGMDCSGLVFESFRAFNIIVAQKL